MGELSFRFERRFRGGPTIGAEAHVSLDDAPVTVLGVSISTTAAAMPAMTAATSSATRRGSDVRAIATDSAPPITTIRSAISRTTVASASAPSACLTSQDRGRNSTSSNTLDAASLATPTRDDDHHDG